MCTRVLWNTSSGNVYCGRSMDWLEDMRSNMWVLPRGMKRNGETVENPLRWTSRYGSVAVTGHDAFTADGINEAGLAMHLLYLSESRTAPRDPALPGLGIPLWGQWVLDTCGSVAEVVQRMREGSFQLRPAVEPHSGMPATVHLAVDDRTGDSAVIEVIDGAVTIYHDRLHTVMTNSPTYDQQLEHLHGFVGFGGTLPLPGTHLAADRFVRAAYYREFLPEPDTERSAVANLLSVMRNASTPYGVVDATRPNIAPTIWRVITNLTDGVIYFDSAVSANIIWADTNAFDYSEGAPVQSLRIVDDFDLFGDVTSQFAPAEMFRFLPATELPV